MEPTTMLVMARKDTRTYAERKEKGQAELHRYQGKTVRLNDDAWEALDARAQRDETTVTQVIRNAVAKYLGDAKLAE